MTEFYRHFERDRLRDVTSIVVHTACVWEVTARKVGNIHPHAAFEKTTYLDFIRSSEALASLFPSFDLNYTSLDIGKTILQAVDRTSCLVSSNTNLGIALLITPLAAIAPKWYVLSNPSEGGIYEFRTDIATVLNHLTVTDAERVFRAITDAEPGGLGKVPKHDVHDTPTVTLLEAMRSAADRDMIARQYANNFADVFDLGVPALLEGYAHFGCVEAAAIHCHLTWLANFSDTLIVRKNDFATAEVVRRWAEDILIVGGLATEEGRAAGVALDAHLRSDGNKLNPGTSADLVAACLFVALREGKIPLNAPFSWKVDGWL